MSIHDADTSRENILRLVRKSASTDYNPESLQAPDDYPEHRKKFLECRKQFEQPPPPVHKKSSFSPYWINPESETDLSITYKKKGTEITDLRISYVNNIDGNDNDIGSQKELEEPRASGSPDSTVDEKYQRANLSDLQNVHENFPENREEANSVGMTAPPNLLLDENPSGTSNEREEGLINGSMISPQQSQFLQKIVEGKSSTMLSKTKATSAHNRIVDTPRENQNILTHSSISGKLIVSKPVVRKLIELKKYDHILADVIN